MKINLIQGFVTLMLLPCVMSSCHKSSQVREQLKDSIPVIAVQPTSVELPRSYVADGQAVQYVEVKPKVEVFVQEIFVDEGQKVKKGQPLFRLSSAEYSENVKEAEANLKQAEAEYQMAVYEAERIQRMVEKDIISRIRLDQVNTAKEVARMKVQQAKVQLQRSRTNYAYTTITSPFEGYIDRIPYKVGSLVNPQSLMTTVSDVSEVFAYYKVNESEYLAFKRAQIKGEEQPELNNIQLVLSDGSTYSYRGRVETVEGDFERGTGSIAFRVRFPNPEGLLKHGVTGRIRMMSKMSDVYLIPQKSTFEIQDFTYVYGVDSTGVVRVRSFEPLERFDNYYVAEDFEPGERLVYEGVQLVKDGMEIKPKVVDYSSVMHKLEHKRDTL